MKLKDAFKRLGRMIRPFICQDDPEEQESRTHETRNEVEPAKRSATQQKIERTSLLEVARPVSDVQVATAEPVEDAKDNNVQGSDVQDGRAQEQWSKRTDSVNSQRVLRRPGQKHEQAEGSAGHEPPPASSDSLSSDKNSDWTPAIACPDRKRRPQGGPRLQCVAEGAGLKIRPARSSQKIIGGSSETTSPVHSSVDEESSTHYQNLAVGAPLSKSLVEQKMGQSERGAKPSDQPYPRLQARLRASDVLMERPSPLLKPPSVPHHNRQHTGPATLRPREVKESQLSSMILSKTPASKRRLLEIYLKGILQELNQDHLTSTFIRARRGCVLNVIWRLHHIGPPALLQESCRTELEANSTLDAAMMALAKHGKELQQIFVQLWADLHQKLNDALVKFEEHQKKLKNRKEPKQWLDAYMCVQSFRRKYQSDVQKITDDFLADGCVNFLHDALGEYAPKSEPLPEEVLRYQPDWKGDGEWPQMPDLPEHDSSYLNDPSFNYREYEEAMS